MEIKTVKTIKAIDLVESKLDDLNVKLSGHFSGAEVIVFRAPLGWGTDDQIRNYIEELKQKSAARTKLCVLIETNGGYVEVVERIYSVFRKHYSEIIFIVPNYAYSAGTVLVLSGDEIYMDSYSVLGPIDPQFESEDGHTWYSGIGYLHKFNELVEKINKATTPGSITFGQPTKAELAYLVKKFDPAKLFQIEQARDHSKELLVEWLPKHKFKNWAVTSTGKTVDARYKEARAADIAAKLAEPKEWHSHSRGIGIRELTDEGIRLKIENFELDQTLNGLVRGYYDLFVDYCSKQSVESAIHGTCGLRSLP